jgi:hypothetical protein
MAGVSPGCADDARDWHFAGDYSRAACIRQRADGRLPGYHDPRPCERSDPYAEELRFRHWSTGVFYF